jgi:hypothetical protein
MADIGTLTPEQMLQQQQILRQQKMAEMLMQQGMQPAQGQMISGRYVAPSWAQNLAGLANVYVGQRGIEKADQAQIDMAKQLRADEAVAMADFMREKQGRAGVEGGIYGPDNKLTTQTTADMYGPDMSLNPAYRQVAPVAAVQGNPQAAYANLLADPRASNRLRDMAFTKMMADPKEFDLPEGAVRYRQNPDGTYAEVATGGEKLTTEYRDYLKAQKDPINPFKGGFTDYQTMNNRSKAATTFVNANNKFTGGFAEKASGGAYDMYTAALNAPQAIENAKRTIELVNSGALTGPTANIGLEAAKIFNVAGANNQDTITKTEQLFSNRGKAMLGAVKGSGLAGSAGLTEGERKFLTQAEGGAITLNGETLKAMAGLEIKLAVANQKKWNAQASKMDKDILNATGAGPVEVYTGIGTIDASNPLLAPRR